MPDAPTTILQLFPLLHVSLRAQNQRQLQGLTSETRQIGERQESNPLCVLVAFIAVHNPVGGVPGRDCREGFATRVEGVGPAFEANRRPDVNPTGTAGCNLLTGSANALANGEVRIMVGHAQLSTGHPKLQKAGIDVHQGCTLEVWKQRGTDSIVKIQQQIRALKDRFSLATGHVEVLFRRFG